MAEYELAKTFQEHKTSIKAIAITPDGTKIISGENAHHAPIKIWELETGNVLHDLNAHGYGVNCLAVSPDGTYFVSGSGRHEEKGGLAGQIWEISSGRVVQAIEDHSFYGTVRTLTSAAITPDSALLVSGSPGYLEPALVIVRDFASAAWKFAYTGHEDRILAVTVTADGKHIVSGSADKTVRVWELPYSLVPRTLAGHETWVNSVAVPKDGKFIVSGAADCIKVWDLVEGELIHDMEGDAPGILSMVISPDGEHAIGGSVDETVKIWEISSGELVQTLEGHGDSVNSVAVSPDGNYIASGSADASIKIWKKA